MEQRKLIDLSYMTDDELLDQYKKSRDDFNDFCVNFSIILNDYLNKRNLIESYFKELEKRQIKIELIE